MNCSYYKRLNISYSFKYFFCFNLQHSIQSQTPSQPSAMERKLDPQSLQLPNKIDRDDSKDGEDLEADGDAEAGTPDSKSEQRQDDSEDLEQMFAAVMTARDGERNISEIFQLLPSRYVSVRCRDE